MLSSPHSNIMSHHVSSTFLPTFATWLKFTSVFSDRARCLGLALVLGAVRST